MSTLNNRTDKIHLPQNIKRLVVLGDPHGDIAGLRNVFEREEGPGVAFVSVGDNVGYVDGPTSSKVCKELMERMIPSVYGNHEDCIDDFGGLAIAGNTGDRFLSQEALSWSRDLPFRLEVFLEGLTDLSIKIVHSIMNGAYWDFISPANAEQLSNKEEVDLVFCGHSHGPRIYTFGRNSEKAIAQLDLDRTEHKVSVILKPSQCNVVDAGSLGRPAYHPDSGQFDHATYAVLDIVNRTVTIYSLTKTD